MNQNYIDEINQLKLGDWVNIIPFNLGTDVYENGRTLQLYHASKPGVVKRVSYLHFIKAKEFNVEVLSCDPDSDYIDVFSQDLKIKIPKWMIYKVLNGEITK